MPSILILLSLYVSFLTLYWIVISEFGSRVSGKLKLPIVHINKFYELLDFQEYFSVLFNEKYKELRVIPRYILSFLDYFITFIFHIIKITLNGLILKILFFKTKKEYIPGFNL